jgi:hypothetical protein
VSTLVVLAFPTEGGAEQVLGVVQDLQRQQLIALDDAATVVRGQDGKPKVRQSTSLVGAGAWSPPGRPAAAEPRPPGSAPGGHRAGTGGGPDVTAMPAGMTDLSDGAPGQSRTAGATRPPGRRPRPSRPAPCPTRRHWLRSERAPGSPQERAAWVLDCCPGCSAARFAGVVGPTTPGRSRPYPPIAPCGGAKRRRRPRVLNPQGPRRPPSTRPAPRARGRWRGPGRAPLGGRRRARACRRWRG